MSAAFVTRLKRASTAFWFHRLNRLPRALCNCSKTKSCATRWEKEPAKSYAKNFCCHAMSSSISISSPNSENEWRAKTCDANGASSQELALYELLARRKRSADRQRLSHSLFLVSVKRAINFVAARF